MSTSQWLQPDTRAFCGYKAVIKMPLHRARSYIQTQHGERAKVGSSKGERESSRPA